MSSQWTNKSAIMKDLARLQGNIPVAVHSTVAAGDKPPDLIIVEETEAEFYQQDLGDGDFAAPELHLIQEMLDLVRDKDLGDEDSNTAFEIAKVNFFKDQKSSNQVNKNVKNETKDKAGISKPFNPLKNSIYKNRNPRKNATVCNEIKDEEKVIKSTGNSSGSKVKRRRNVAMESIMKSFNSFGIDHSKVLSPVNKTETHNGPVIMSKPDDFQVSKSTDKVQEWIQNQETSPYSYSSTVATQLKPQKSIEKSNIKSTKPKEHNTKIQDEKSMDVKPTWIKMDFDPTSMFKKKTKSVEVQEIKVVLPTIPGNTPKNYVPSSWADEFYKKYMIKQIIKEDIWMKVGERIDEIEEQKEAEAEKQRLLEEAEKEKLKEAEKQKLLEVEKEQALLEAATESEVNESGNDPEQPEDQPISELKSVIANEKTEPNFTEEKFDIHLPVHRHLMTENCIVCEVLCGKGTKKTEGNVIENWREKME